MKISTFFTALLMLAVLFLSHDATAQSATDRADKVSQEMIDNYGLAADLAKEVRDYNRLIAERLEGISKATANAADARTRKLDDYENRYMARMKDLLGKSTFGRVKADLEAYYEDLQK